MRLALGTVQFGLNYGVANNAGCVDPSDVSAILVRAKEVGINTLDTAISYGVSESVLGQNNLTDLRVISKIPPIPDNCDDIKKWIRGQLEASLNRLGIASLYGLLLHQPEQLIGSSGDEIYDALMSIKADGLVSKIGISIYKPSELMRLFESYSFDLVQAPLNIIDRGFVDDGYAGWLKNLGVEVHVRSIFLQGLLIMPSNERPNKFNRWSNVWNIWDKWLSDNSMTAVEACLSYVYGLDVVDYLVVGVNSVSQLNELIEATNLKLKKLPFFEPLQDDRLINPTSWSQL